ncbi:MAG: type II toxin-antitoxin system HipA family toxin [Hydrogenobaculum sp.]|nr:MAG: type II toxin-antitoxin system HipA family toxin [Hydrogenobaculum sp.]
MDIKVSCNGKPVGNLFEGKDKEYVFEYLAYEKPDKHNIYQNSVSISMPFSQRIHISKFYLHPFFDSFLPEGYLFEVLKSLINKREGKIDDFILLRYLAPGIEGRVTFGGETSSAPTSINLEDILTNDTWDTFKELLSMFLNKNAVSGVQPKTIAVIKDKTSLDFKEFIVKTFGDEYPNLVENEYFCMKAVERTGVKIPKIYISENKKFLVIEKFIYNENGYLGFEEIGSILGRRRHDKYEGSYEQIAKTIKRFSTNVAEDLKSYYKMIVMNFLIKNGDAHNKNFGLLYSKDISHIWLAPAYDVVCTSVYIKNDQPALFLGGTKKWVSKKELVEFGLKYCALEEEDAKEIFDNCKEALIETINDVKNYMKQNPNFQEIGNRLIKEWEESLDKT